MASGSPGRARLATFAITAISIVVFAVLVAGVVGVLARYAIGAVALVVGIVLFARWQRARPAAKAEKELQRLVALCHGDRAMAERLVAGEERRSPGVGRGALVRRAVERLREDRRR